MSTSKRREVKVVLLGDQGVGKSSLVLRFVTNNFKFDSETTIGASFMSKMIMIPQEDGEQMMVNFKIWDTAGQEKYHSLAPMYYRGAAAAIVVYDITRRKSFDCLKNWINELSQLGPEDIIIAVAGNKSDLKDEREIETSEAMSYCNESGYYFKETSAKSDLNIFSMFTEVAKLVCENGNDGNAGGYGGKGGGVGVNKLDLGGGNGRNGSNKFGCC